ncbi:flagellar export chaperone FliS [bacterium]|nr:flagellar export chaperone FliS [bacterium]
MQVETASPEKILIMLYNGAINFLKKAKVAFEENNKVEAHNNIIAAEKIILEFMTTLDMDLGGEMAKNLYALYDYLYNRLVESNMKNKPEIIDEVLDHLVKLRDTWNKAIEISNREKAETDGE